jgi:hypothetical protein
MSAPDAALRNYMQADLRGVRDWLVGFVSDTFCYSSAAVVAATNPSLVRSIDAIIHQHGTKPAST